MTLLVLSSIVASVTLLLNSQCLNQLMTPTTGLKLHDSVDVCPSPLSQTHECVILPKEVIFPVLCVWP